MIVALNILLFVLVVCMSYYDIQISSTTELTLYARNFDLLVQVMTTKIYGAKKQLIQ